MTGRRRLAQLLRELGDAVVRVDAEDTEFEAVAALLEPLRDRLASHPSRSRQVGLGGGGEGAGQGFDYGSMTDFSPISGLSNPLAPPVSLRLDGEVARGQVTYGNAYEGPPGGVHGGYVAASFDELFGLAHALTGAPGMTGSLRVRYQRLAPLHVPLQLEGHVKGEEGRKVFVTSTLRAEQTTVARADAVFIRIDPDRYAVLASLRNRSGR